MRNSHKSGTKIRLMTNSHKLGTKIRLMTNSHKPRHKSQDAQEASQGYTSGWRRARERIERHSRRAVRGCALPPPLPRTKWTRRVPHPVLIGHGAGPAGACVGRVAGRLARAGGSRLPWPMIALLAPGPCAGARASQRAALRPGEGRGVSDWYGVRDAACPISTRGGGGGRGPLSALLCGRACVEPAPGVFYNDFIMHCLAGPARSHRPEAGPAGDCRLPRCTG